MYEYVTHLTIEFGENTIVKETYDFVLKHQSDIGPEFTRRKCKNNW